MLIFKTINTTFATLNRISYISSKAE